MDEIILNSLTQYYAILKQRGYYNINGAIHILVLCFFRDFVYNDYNGLITKADYSLIEKALNCLFGSNCLIPYPDYLKMGKLHLGEMTEMAQRVKTLEETKVLKAMDADDSSDSDIIIIEEKEE